MTETVQYSRSEHVGTLLLNHPDRHNSLGREQLDAIEARLEEVDNDPSVRVLVVTGAGEKTFCAGAALQELGSGEMNDDAFQHMTARMAAMRIPTLCALNGNVFGGGVELAVSCDFRIGIQGMRMRVPAAQLGICYPAAGVERFVQCLGVRVTRRVLMAAESFEGEVLLDIGFLDQLVARENFQQLVTNRAQELAGLAPMAVQSMKTVLGQAATEGIDTDMARELSARCMASQDLQEGLQAQRRKRKPRFVGR